jgi:uncharacterized membrane protein
MPLLNTTSHIMHQFASLLIFASLFFLFYLLLYSAFEGIGFKKWEAILIVFSSVFFSWINIPLFIHGKWTIAINVGGALIPIFVSIYLMISRRVSGRIILGIPLVAFVTYNVTRVTSEGIVSSFPWWLIPPLCASFYSIIVCNKNKRKASSIAYASGTIGVLIGADVFHLHELLSMDVAKDTLASIGGAAILDMVFLTGIIAVLIDIFLYGEQT